MTAVEVFVVIAMVFILAVMFLSTIARRRAEHMGINCVSNLKQVDLSFRIWEEDNNNKYPMAVSVTNGGARELIATGGVATCYQVMSNELSTPKILICPEDRIHTYATNFDNDFNASHISYFVGANVTNETNSAMLLVGDDNFQINGSIVPSGMLQLATNAPISWTAARHKHVGNIGMADGSVFEVSTLQLQEALQQTGMATNRLAIP